MRVSAPPNRVLPGSEARRGDGPVCLHHDSRQPRFLDTQIFQEKQCFSWLEGPDLSFPWSPPARKLPRAVGTFCARDLPSPGFASIWPCSPPQLGGSPHASLDPTLISPAPCCVVSPFPRLCLQAQSASCWVGHGEEGTFALFLCRTRCSGPFQMRTDWPCEWVAMGRLCDSGVRAQEGKGSIEGSGDPEQEGVDGSGVGVGASGTKFFRRVWIEKTSACEGWVSGG